MAVRDRNLFAWQAYVIVASFLSVILLVLMFFVWRSNSDLSKRFDAQAEDLANTKKQYTDWQGRAQRLMAMLGEGEQTQQNMEADAQKYAADPEMAEVEKKFADAMKLFAPTDADNQKNLFRLSQSLLETLRQRNQQIEEARNREKALADTMDQTVQRETKAREVAELAQQKAENDLKDARQTHSAAIAKLNAEKDENVKRFGDYKQLMDGKLAQLAQANKALETKVAQQAETIAIQAVEINQFKDPDFAAPQGEIVKTADGGQKVWVNLGRSSSLREGVPFSVIDADETRTTDATAKAQIKIIRVVGDRLAYAEVLDYDYRNPIVSGDKIYSPVWRPGREVGFALVGLMDTNDDRKDDLDQVRQLIELSGGKIDAYLDARGNREDLSGLSPNTSFLVLGTDVSDFSASSRPDQLKKGQEYKRFIEEAQALGISTISLDKLLGYLKTDSSDRTIPLGDRIRGQDFEIDSRRRPPSTPGIVSEIYRKRSPN